MKYQEFRNDLRKKSILETTSRLSQTFFKTFELTPSQALFKAYTMLTEEQKIAFLLAGGTQRLVQWQRSHLQTTRTHSDTETGQLPVPCHV
jgi:hypothetical protein